MKKKLDVDTIVANEIAELQRFASIWKRGTIASKKHFPATMHEGEWFEQIITAIENGCDDLEEIVASLERGEVI